MAFELKGWHVLSMMLAFFGVIVGVNVIFAFYALDTFTGEDTPLAYMKGLAYNETLDAHAAQARLGWTAQVGVVRGDAGAGVVDVRLASAAGAVAGLDLTVTLRRPTDSDLDRTIALRDAGGGAYEGVADDLKSGQWDVIVRTKAQDGTPFEALRRVQVP